MVIAGGLLLFAGGLQWVVVVAGFSNYVWEIIINVTVAFNTTLSSESFSLGLP